MTLYNVRNSDSDSCADYLHKVMKRYGINFATGVPCAIQKHIIYNLSHDPDITHISVTREAEAIGLAAGAYLAGRKPVVYMQNSGLFDSSNDIASLLMVYKIPLLLSVTWRGCPGDDTPQHAVTGKATTSLLDSIGVPYEILRKDSIDRAMSKLFESMEERQIPAAFIVWRGWNK